VGFRDDLKATLSEKRQLQTRLDSIQPARPLTDRAGFIDLCDRLAHHLPKLVDREQQKAFLQRIVPEIRLGETLEIDRTPDPGNDPDAGITKTVNRRKALLAIR
jgi:hypothetical protein